ncbi:MAG: hypothetical protein ABSB35_20015 [Bryobacteraceae bacterium]|jgi:hypothetical protein
MRNPSTRLAAERGNTMLEFALVMSVLVPLFAGMFSIGMTLAKGIEVSNVCEDAVLLLVDSVTNPNSGLDLSQTQNQRIIVRAATGLGMASDSSYDPSSTGNAAVILSKVVMVGPTECSLGVVPAPHNAPPWNASNCPNYGQYVFEYRVAFGNTGRWSSTIGSPPSSIVRSNGTITAANIATDTSDVASNFGAGGVMTLSPSTFALVSEMWADVSNLNIFSIWHTPVVYSRSIS